MATKLSEKRIEELILAEKKLEREREKRRGYTRKRNAKLAILAKKALKAGITVTEKEIDEYLSKK